MASFNCFSSAYSMNIGLTIRLHITSLLGFGEYSNFVRFNVRRHWHFWAET